jgi:hypothetical protein
MRQVQEDGEYYMQINTMVAEVEAVVKHLLV